MAEAENRKIPVFTVLKNGAILKNIFIFKKPSAEPSPPSSFELNPFSAIQNAEDQNQEMEEILVVGRHPDCNIMLTHPSISRFHLQINSRSSSQKLSVVDLSSVHGTWVSEKKIEPGVPVELNEGDTLRVGGSTRIYRLHWIPLSHAYEIENHLKDLHVAEEKEEDSAGEGFQDENTMSIEDECTKDKDPLVVKDIREVSKSGESEESQPASLDVILEGEGSIFSDESSGLVVKKETPSAPPVPEDRNFSICNEEDDSPSRRSETTNEQFDTFNLRFQHDSITDSISGRENEERSVGSSDHQTNLLENFDTSSSVLEELEVHLAAQILERHDNQKPLQNVHQEMDIPRLSPELLKTESVNSTLPEILTDANICMNFDTSSSAHSSVENQKPLQKEHQELYIPGLSPEPSMTESVNTFSAEVLTDIYSKQVNEENQAPQPLLTLQPPFERGKKENAEADREINLLVDLNHTGPDEHRESPVTEITKNDEKESISKKECECESESFYSVPQPSESINSSFPTNEVCSEYEDNEKSRTPESLQAPILLSEGEKLDSAPRSERRSKLGSLRSRRGDVEEEIFTPDKGSFTPHTLLLKSLKRKAKLEGSKEAKVSSNMCASSSPNTTSSPIVQRDEDLIASSDRENQTPKIPEQQKQVKSKKDRMVTKRTTEGAPLQYFLANPAGKSISEASVPKTTTGSNKSVYSKTIKKRIAHTSSNNSVGERRNTWTMVTDITSLMDRKSRKSLQLLQGLKGTRLIIPRMVTRELDLLNWPGSLFRRKTEAASVLEWIEDCMVKTKWWIHVQRSVEEEQQILLTPPASPQSQFRESSEGIFPGAASATESFTQIASPTVEDHVLDFALRFRTMKNGQLILLSNEVTMKIKAMAEGLLCETAPEFWESLVNPFSDRFLWAESSPRGQTWSYLDDVVLREWYFHRPLKRSSKGESAKGLKLILLHNSHYGRLSCFR
ncbi:hypothetical protein SLE2022_328460 [Rubroshorea leprosula]